MLVLSSGSLRFGGIFEVGTTDLGERGRERKGEKDRGGKEGEGR